MSKHRSVVVVLTVGSLMSASAQAQWAVTLLHPSSEANSKALGGGGAQQVGQSFSLGTGTLHASLWGGSSASWVDLHPAGATESGANRAEGGFQVGFATIGGRKHASIWNGTAASRIDLFLAGDTGSEVFGISGNQQVGVRNGTACLWSGTAVSALSIQPDPPGQLDAFGSMAFDVHGGVQVGYVLVALFGVPEPAVPHASLWTGTAASWVDLNPSGMQSIAYAVDSGEQVGVVRPLTGSLNERASLWRGTAASIVNLHPAEAIWSIAKDVHNGEQVGTFVASDLLRVAVLWRGTLASMVKLHEFLPSAFEDSTAESIWSDDQFTYVAGWGYNTFNGRNEAILWRRPHIPCVGDANGDFQVDFGDVTAALSNFGTSGGNGFAAGDADHDGDVDFGDIAASLSSFGFSCL